MSEKIRKLKEDAARLIAKGKLDEACDCYEKVVKTDSRDLTARQKLAEIYAKLGKTERAVHVYQSVAGSYAADGLLLKAIAVCKIILQIDPRHTETQTILAGLSTKRRGGGTENVVEMPKAMSEALGGKKSAASIRGIAANQIRGVSAQQVRSAPSVALDQSADEPMQLERGVSSSSLSASSLTPLGRPPRASVEELTLTAAAVLPEAPPPLVAGTAMPDDIAVDVTFDDAEPVVMGAAHERPSLSGAPILTAAINASLPSFDELMAATPGPEFKDFASRQVLEQSILFDRKAVEYDDVSVTNQQLTSADGPAIVDEALRSQEAEDDFGNLDAVAARTAGTIRNSADDAGFDPHGNDEVCGTNEVVIDDSDDDDDDTEVVDIADVQSAHIDVDRVPPIPLFSDLPHDAFVALTERMDLRVASSGDVLIAESEPGVSMFIIIQGRVKVVRSGEDGEEILLAQLSDGTFFGEMALLSDAPRTASVVCVEETMLFEISRELLKQMTARYPSVGEVMKKFHKNRLITNLLKTSPIFAPFSANDKKALIEKFKSRQVDDGAYLITREKPGDGLYVVLAGRCEVLDVNSAGEEVTIAELREGDVFGEMSMLWHKETCASVRATTSCTVLRLPRTSFTEVIMTHPQILETLSALSERRVKLNTELKAAGIASDFLV